jgi:hypothetical protein
MKFSGETLMAYTDGELDAPTCREIEAAISGDPDVARQISRQRALQSSLRVTFEPVLHDAVPQRLIDAARRTENAPNTQSLKAVHTWRLPVAAAVVALLGGLLLGRLSAATSKPLFTTIEGRMLAQGTLGDALSKQPGGTEPLQSEIVIGLSYLAKSGVYCRTFTVRQSESIAGVACRDAQGWQIQAMAQTGPKSPLAQYRMAGTLVPPLILGTVESTMDGSPLDAEAETAARGRDWLR